MGNFVTGILIIVVGIFCYITGWDSRHGFAVPKSTGIFIALVGFAMIIYAAIDEHKTLKCKKREWLVCNDCNGVYPKEEVLIKTCPICNAKLIEFKTFIQKYPGKKGLIKSKITSWPGE